MSNFLNFAGNSGVTFKTFTASGGTTYTLDKSASTNSVLVSVGGVLQKPATDYSVSGTTLTTTSTVTTGIVIDTYIIHDAGNAPVIEDNSVTRGKLDLVSTSSAPGATIKGDGTTDGYIQLNCSQNSHGIKLKSPAHSAGASYTLVLPTTDGNANEFLQTNGSGVTTWAEAGGGKIVARYYDEDAVHATTTTSIPSDDTVPTSSEGTATNLSITTNALASSSNRLRVRVCGCLSNSATQDMLLVLFDGSTAVRTVWATARYADWPEPLVMEYEVAPGATTAKTYSVRYGSTSGTCAKNGTTATRRYGGTAALTMIVEEIEP